MWALHNKWKTIFGGAIVLALILYLLVPRTKEKMLKIAYTSPWNTIHPGLQHTLMGDLVLSNQFESLVGLNDAGVSIPLASSKWSISDDQRVFTFKIDTSKKFSDGAPLRAEHFKAAWENSLAMDPVSANSSLLDVLYKVEGFDKFKETGHLSGLKVVSSDTLEVHFSSPFRMALEHLQGNRFSAFREVQGKYLGTGAYVIEENGENHLRFLARKDLSPEIPDMDVVWMKTASAVEKVKAGNIDVIPYLISFSNEADELNDPRLEVLVGQDAVHLAIGVNGTTESIFHNKSFRKALQYLFLKVLAENRKLLPPSPFFETDAQVFLPFQSGRISDTEAKIAIDDGRAYVDKLISASEKRPVTVHYLKSQEPIFKMLKMTGVKISTQSKMMDVKEHIQSHYSKSGPDLLVMGFGVASGDPDGIYHKYGENGAIRTPYVFDKKVALLLEEGRKMVDLAKIDEFYQKISHEILDSVPTIHVGFSKAVMVYNKETVRVDSTVMRRNLGQLHILRAK